MKFIDLGRIDFKSAFQRQLALVNQFTTPTILLCEHEPCVYTAGKRLPDFESSPDASRLRQLGAQCISTNRGGLITWHGKGQLTVYPVLDISAIGMREYVHRLETIVMAVGQRFGVDCERMAEVGVAAMVNNGNGVERRKFGFIGVAQSHGISYHGVAINVNNDLKWFSEIIPCGIEGLFVTNLEKETKKVIEVEAVKKVIQDAFIQQFAVN